MALRDWLWVATVATPATDGRYRTPSVATVATVAVAGGENARPATPAQAAELRGLIGVLLANDSDADRAEALIVACADPAAALLSFRVLAAPTENSGIQADDRRPCTDCANLTARDQRCLAAWRGEQVGGGHGREYHPVIDLPQRCIGYAAKASELDQRTGAQRWSNLARVNQQ